MPTIKTDIDFIRQICEHQPESVVWVMPVWTLDGVSGEERIIDFEFQYCNAASEAVTGKPPAYLLGKRVMRDQLPDPGSYPLIFEQCLRVYQSGEPMEFTYLSPELDKYLTLHRVKVQDGVLTTARNRTAEYKVNLEKEQQSKLLHSLIDHSPYGICFYESVRDSANVITDFRLKICNKKSAELTALSVDQLYGNTVKELMTLRGHSGFFDTCKAVVETGESNYLEFYSEERDQWLGFSIVKFDDGYLLNYIDITENKRLAIESSQKANELDAIFNGSLSGVYTARTLRNEAGRIYDFVFLRANEAFFKIFKAAPDRIIGKTLLSLSGADSQTAFMAYANEVMKTGVPTVQVLQYHQPERWFEFSMVKLQEDILSVTVNDITAQRKAALKIEEQKSLLDSILTYSPNGLAITQALRNGSGEMVDARTVLMNEACETFNGVPNEVMLANPFSTLSPELLDSPLFKAAAALPTGGTFRTEYELPQTGKWIELAIAKMDEERFVNVFTDITAVKEAQVHLEQLVDELKRSNANLEEFAYAASHDLKEPIRKIRVFAEQLKIRHHDSLDDVGRNTFERLEMAALRMNQLIEDLLKYAHVNQGIPEPEEVDLNAKLQKALEDLELVISEKAAVVHAAPLPVVRGNKRQLQQLLQNLVGNALKYNVPGTPPEVWIGAEQVTGADIGLDLPSALREQSFYRLQVRDRGIGFQQKDADRIFNVFTRLHGSAEHRGTGVGLSIVRKVVENHKGFIKAESSPGAGATFNIYLPV